MASDFYIKTANGEKVLVGIIKGKNPDGAYQIACTFKQLKKLVELRPDLFPLEWTTEKIDHSQIQ